MYANVNVGVGRSNWELRAIQDQLATSFPDWQNDMEKLKLQSTATVVNTVVNLQQKVHAINRTGSGMTVNQVMLGLEFFIDFARDVIQQRNRVLPYKNQKAMTQKMMRKMKMKNQINKIKLPHQNHRSLNSIQW